MPNRTAAADRGITRPPRSARPLSVAPDALDDVAAWVPLSVAAERVSLCERTIRRAITAGELPGYKFGKALRVRLADVDAWAMGKAMPHARTRKAGGAR